MRNLAPTVAAVLLLLSLTGCGSDGDDHSVVSDPAPTAEPTVGSYPAFEPTDYTFELSVSCFCAGAGVPIEVTVADAEVVGAVYGMDGGRGGATSGDPADKSFWLTIDDIIDKANDTEADLVEVDWPDGQDYPNSVYVDTSRTVADDEVHYTVADVAVR
jgi:hypothetical protein